MKDPREEWGTPGRSWGPQGGVGTPGRGRGSQGGAGDPREGPGTQGGAGDPREGLGTPGRSGEPQGETGHLATADPPGGFGREDKQRLQGDPSQEPGQPRWVGARLQVAVFDLTHPQPPEEQVETRVLLARSSRSHQPCPPCPRGLEPRGERAAPPQLEETPRRPRPREVRAFFSCLTQSAIPSPLSKLQRRLDSL